MPTLLPVCAPTHPPTPIPTPSAPLHQPTPLPPVGVGGGSVGVVGSVTTWCTHWLCWCCPLPSHTHRACEARGGGGCVWCGCHHHCAPFPPTTTTVCAAPPCPLCVCVGGGTGHSGALWWHARWCGAVLGAWPPHPPPTLSTLVASLLSPAPKPTLTHTHKWHCSLHTHTWRALCASSHPLTHTLVASLPTHPPHTHWWVCVCSSTCSHAPSHTQRRHRRGACLAALVLWSPPPRPLCHTQGLVVGAMVVVGGGRVGTVWLPRHATHSPCLPPHTPHPPPHTPWRVVCLARLATPTTTTQPHHTHTTTATVPQWWLPLVTTPSTHPTLATHTPHTHQGQAQTWLWLLVWHHHHAGVGHSLSSLLPFLSTNPFLSLSLACTHTPHPLINNTTIPSIPCVVCVLWEWTDGWTTLWLSTPHTALLMGVLIGDTIQPFHPPSPLSLCFCPPPTTTPSLFSAHHTTHRGERESGDGLVGVVGV